MVLSLLPIPGDMLEMFGMFGINFKGRADKNSNWKGDLHLKENLILREEANSFFDFKNVVFQYVCIFFAWHCKKNVTIKAKHQKCFPIVTSHLKKIKIFQDFIQYFKDLKIYTVSFLWWKTKELYRSFQNF